MPGLAAIVERISLDVTRGLVVDANLGLGFDGARYTATGDPPPLGIVGATNATPIVITTAQAHLAPPQGLHVIIAGVTGNAAANNIDPADGQPGGVLALPLTSTTLALYGVDPATGFLAALVGSGTYTGGGTLTPALTDGRILMGREHTPRKGAEQSAPPRIVMVPTGTAFGPRAVSDRRNGGSASAAELRREWATRSIKTDRETFEVHTWGEAADQDPVAGFDATQVLYQQVIQSVHLLTVGDYELTAGRWADQDPKETQILKAGHWHVFGVSIATPILDAALLFVPAGTTGAPTTNLVLPTGATPEVGCSG